MQLHMNTVALQAVAEETVVNEKKVEAAIPLTVDQLRKNAFERMQASVENSPSDVFGFGQLYNEFTDAERTEGEACMPWLAPWLRLVGTLDILTVEPYVRGQIRKRYARSDQNMQERLISYLLKRTTDKEFSQGIGIPVHKAKSKPRTPRKNPATILPRLADTATQDDSNDTRSLEELMVSHRADVLWENYAHFLKPLSEAQLDAELPRYMQWLRCPLSEKDRIKVIILEKIREVSIAGTTVRGTPSDADGEGQHEQVA